MPGIHVRPGQPIELVLKLLKKQIEKSGVMAETRKRKQFEKPSVKKRKKSALARKRLIKQQR